MNLLVLYTARALSGNLITGLLAKYIFHSQMDNLHYGCLAVAALAYSTGTYFYLLILYFLFFIIYYS